MEWIKSRTRTEGSRYGRRFISGWGAAEHRLTWAGRPGPRRPVRPGRRQALETRRRP